MSTLALSYDELADRLGITVASARRLVLRRRWSKGRGNDGRAIVQVPEEFLERRSDSPSGSPADDTPDAVAPVAPAVVATDPEPSADARALLDMLQSRVAELDSEVKEARATVTALTAELSAKTTRAEVLDALLQAEKRRGDELAADRDRWHATATATPPGFLARLRRALG
jgi:hypothetical protein